MALAITRISSPLNPIHHELYSTDNTITRKAEQGSTKRIISYIHTYLGGEILEPEVHIVDRYMQLVKKCFTMTNIMLEGGKEIDLLAFDPISKEKYHIEVRVATGKGFRLRLIDTQTKKGRKHRRGLDTLNEIKFAHSTVVNAVKEIFGGGEYKKVLVVWDVEDSTVIEQAKNLYKIEIWRIPNIISELTREVKSKPYRNDVLRTIQLISKKTDLI